MPCALASRSLMRETWSKPICSAIWRASTAHGRLEVSTWPSSTAPAIPKQAAVTVWLCLARNFCAISSGPLYSRTGKYLDGHRLKTVRRTLEEREACVGAADITCQNHFALLQWR